MTQDNLLLPSKAFVFDQDEIWTARRGDVRIDHMSKKYRRNVVQWLEDQVAVQAMYYFGYRWHELQYLDLDSTALYDACQVVFNDQVKALQDPHAWLHSTKLIQRLNEQPDDLPVRANNPVVLVDMDGVLTDWSQGVYDRAYKIADRNDIALTLPEPSQWVAWDVLSLVPAGEQRMCVREAMRDGDLYDELPAIPGAVNAIREMLKEGIQVFFCTQPDLDNKLSALHKIGWLTTQFGADIAERAILTWDKTLVVGDLLVDDKPRIDGLRTPVWTQIVFDQPYNQAATGPRLYNWDGWRDVILPALRHF